MCLLFGKTCRAAALRESITAGAAIVVELLQRVLWFGTTIAIIPQWLGGEQREQSKEEKPPVYSTLPPLFAKHQQRRTRDERVPSWASSVQTAA